MERPEEGLPTTTVLEIEDRADLIALEFLAPSELVVQHVKGNLANLNFAERQQYIQSVLIEKYGLPQSVANLYSKQLLQKYFGPTVRDWLKGLV